MQLPKHASMEASRHCQTSVESGGPSGSGSGAAVRASRADRPVRSPLPTSCCAAVNSRLGRVEDGRGSLGPIANAPFPSAHRMRISRIRLSDWLHREAHGESLNRARLQHGGNYPSPLPIQQSPAASQCG